MRRRDLEAFAADLADGVDFDPAILVGASPRQAAALGTLRRLSTSSLNVGATSDNRWLLKIGRFLAGAAIVQVAITFLVIATLPDLPSGGPVPREFQVITLVVSTVAAMLLLGIGDGDRGAHALAISYLGMSAAFATALSRFSPAWLPDAFEPWRRGFVGLPFELALVCGAWSFIAVFPRIEEGSRIQTSINRGIDVVTVLVSGLLTLNLWLAVFGREPSNAISRAALLFDRHTTGSWYWVLYFLALVPAALLALAKLKLGYVARRRQARLFLVGLFLGFGPIVLLAAITLFSSAAAAFLRTEAVFPVLMASVFGGLWSLPFTTGVSVLTRGVLPIKLVVRRSLHYALATSTLSVMVVAPGLIAVVLLIAYPQRTVGEFLGGGGAWWLTLGGVSIALIFGRRHILEAVDLLFDRSRIDARRLISEIGAFSRRKLGPKNAADIVLAGIDRAFRPLNAAVLVSDGEGLLRPLAGKASPIAVRSALGHVLAAGPGAISFEVLTANRISTLLPHEEIRFVEAEGWRIVVPLLSDGEALVGALCAGERLSHADYSRDDLSTLEAICAAAGPLIANRLQTEGSLSSADSIPGGECPSCGLLFGHLEARCSCGEPLVGSMLPRRIAGRYVLRRRLGRGGMGVVYEALDEQLQRPVALKTLPEAGADEIAQLRQEARMMASLQHPDLAQVLGFETVGPLPVLVVEYLSGGTLADRIHVGPLSVAEVAQLGIQIADALEHLHSSGVLHRDLKPSNIGFLANRRAKLMDFGLAIPLAQASSATCAGTLKYASPEVLSGLPPTIMCDLWSLGVVLSELVESVAEIDEADIHFRLALARIVSTSLEADLAYRYPDASTMRAALTALN